MTRFRIINWWISRKLENLHIMLAFAGVIICLAGMVSGEMKLCRYGASGLTILAVIYFLHEHLYRFRQYLKDYENQDRLPLQRMKQINGILMVLYISGFLLLVKAGRNLPWKALGDFAKTFFVAVMGWIVSLIPAGEEAVLGEGKEASGYFSIPELLPAKTLPFMEFLDQVLYVLLIFLAAGGVIWGLMQAGKKLAAYLISLSFDEDEAVFLKPESFREWSKKERRNHSWSKYVPFFGLNSQGRIRRLYWNCIQKEIKKQKEGNAWERMPYMTPEQLEDAAGICENEMFHKLYEKARYSQKGCDAWDECQMRAFCREIGKKLSSSDSD